MIVTRLIFGERQRIEILCLKYKYTFKGENNIDKTMIIFLFFYLLFLKFIFLGGGGVSGFENKNVLSIVFAQISKLANF